MKRSLVLSSLLILLAMHETRASLVIGGVVVDGVAVEGSCEPAAATDIEFYIVKVPEGGSGYTDWLYVKGDVSRGGATQRNFGYTVTAANFSAGFDREDRYYIFLTSPGGDGGGDLIALDATNNSAPNPGAATFQVVGNTIPGGFDGYAGTGVVFDDRGLPTSIDLGAGPRAFPAAGRSTVDVVFGALIDYQPALYFVGASCGFGMGLSHQLFPELGMIVGYNVYRQVDAGTAPAKESWGAEHWLTFLPAHDESGDLFGTVDLNGQPSDGDEYLFFSDADLPGLRDSPLEAPEPACARRYWYVIQPVVEGDYEAWTSETELGRVPLGFEPKLPDGGIDITGDGEPEFFSPQAIQAGMPGLGLTVQGRPLISAPVLGCTAADPLSATGRVELRGGTDGLELLVGAEAADVLGYDVYRLTGTERTRINRSLLPAQGLDGGVVSVDTVLRGRRLAGTYEVEVVTSDGDALRVFGPFTVGATERRSSRRVR
ncbi:MAG: hypothetical protein AAF533_00710 [Acidobacteriota bacterium]